MTSSFSLEDCFVDPDAGEVTDANGRLHHLSPRAMQLLVVFAQHPGEILTREVLVELAWVDHKVRPESVGPAISEIRHSLNDDARHPKYIETLLGKGYRLIIEPDRGNTKQLSVWQSLQQRKVFRAATLYAITSFVILQLFDATSDALGLLPGTQRILLACLIGGFPVVVLLAWYLEISKKGLVLDPRRFTEKTSRRSEAYLMLVVVAIAAFVMYQILIAPTQPDGPIRVAVLPFNNFTGDPDNDYLSDGIGEELLDVLQRYEGLSVLAHSATYHYKNKNVDFQTIAETLQADAIVEGSLLDKKGNRIRVVAQLVDGTTGIHKWSNVYDHELNDFLSIKHDVARKMAGALNLVLDENAQPEVIETDDAQAYDLYLQGMDYLRRQINRQDQEVAERLFLRVLDLDADFSPALYGLCKIRLEMYVLSRAVEDYDRGTDTCRQLTAADSLSVEALVAMGDFHRLSDEIDEAIPLYERAIALAPRYEPAYYGLSRSYEAKQEFGAAERYALQGIAAERAYWKAYTAYAGFLFRQGRYEEAAAQSARVTELTPDNPVGWGNLGAAYFASDKWESAEIAWQRAFNLQPTVHGFANLGTLLYYQYRFEDARRLLELGVENYPGDHRLLSKLGAVYRQTPDMKAKALEFYQRAFQVTQEALRVNANDAVLLAHHAYYAAAIGNEAEAYRAIAKAAEVQPNNPEVTYLHAYVIYLLDAGDWSEYVSAALDQGYSVRQAARDPMFKSEAVSDGRQLSSQRAVPSESSQRTPLRQTIG